MVLLPLAALFTLVTVVTSVDFGAVSSLCNTTIDNANASGVFPYNPQYQNLPQASWATTVYDTNGTTETTLWFSTGGANYSDDLAILTDACAFRLRALPLNTNELAQDDPGDCSRVLSMGCRQALESRMASSANLYTTYASPPPYSNLTAGVLPYICSDISSSFYDGGNYQFPKKCAKEFGMENQANDGTMEFNTWSEGFPLTGHNSSTSITGESTCSLADGGTTFHSVETTANSTTGSYDSATRDMTLIMSVYFQVANVERQGCCNYPSTQLVCVRPQKFSQGSRVSPVLAKGTPYTYPTNGSKGGLREGDLAGVVVGPVVFAIIIAGLGFWFWRRRRASCRGKDVKDIGEDSGDVENDAKEIGNGTGRHELSEVDRKQEADSATVSEMGPGYWKWVELSSDEPAKELDGRPV